MKLSGFIDGHLHVLGVGYYQTIIDLSNTQSIEEVIRILSSKKDEKIIIGQDIEITVVGIDNGSVQLGISAPKEIEILRKELLEDVKKENRAAAENKELLKKLQQIKFNAE
jgi:carbon storage regulator